ncbi:hypothetical protein HMI56_000431 [Coelomomyces lativittatus]|nr:hypothetical protein HMI56_000431 [Coelomomyces lativittatus]
MGRLRIERKEVTKKESIAHVLNEELTTWLAQATSLPSSKEPSCHVPAPISHAIGLIAPHAGYRYSGPTAAYAYAALDTSTIDRVILLGPTHHEFIDGCALSQCDVFETPLGSFEAADLTEFNKSGLFSPLSMKADEKEHSLEMQLPYLYKRFKDDGEYILPN